jgi:hypothetical protein
MHIGVILLQHTCNKATELKGEIDKCRVIVEDV